MLALRRFVLCFGLSRTHNKANAHDMAKKAITAMMYTTSVM